VSGVRRRGSAEGRGCDWWKLWTAVLDLVGFDSGLEWAVEDQRREGS